MMMMLTRPKQTFCCCFLVLSLLCSVVVAGGGILAPKRSASRGGVGLEHNVVQVSNQNEEEEKFEREEERAFRFLLVGAGFEVLSMSMVVPIDTVPTGLPTVLPTNAPAVDQTLTMQTASLSAQSSSALRKAGPVMIFVATLWVSWCLL